MGVTQPYVRSQPPCCHSCSLWIFRREKGRFKPAHRLCCTNRLAGTRRQAGSLDNILSADVLHLRLGGFRRLTIVGVFRWVRDGAGDSLTVTEDRHPVLRALALELEDVLLVVANVMEQLVPNGPFVIEAPAPQRLQGASKNLSLPTLGKITSS